MEKKQRSRRLLGRYDGKKLEWFHTLRDILVGLTVAFAALQFIVGASQVRGNSMYPTLHDGQIVLYNRISSSYKKGDVISVKMPSGECYVKRVAAVGGDTVELRGGALYINGQKESGNYINGATQPQEGLVKYPCTVEEGKLFVVGDNRADSVDSRTFGAVVEEQVKGKLLFVH